MKYYVIVLPNHVSLIDSFSLIHPQTTKLNLTKQNLGSRNIMDLIKAIAYIPKSVTDLDIRDNNFNNIADEQFAILLNHLPVHIQSLHIDYVDFLKLVKFTNTLAVPCLPSIFATLKTLKLDGNHYTCSHLNGTKAREFIDVLLSVPNNISKLELNFFAFGNAGRFDLLINCFKFLSKTINFLGLRGNNLVSINYKILKQLFAIMPQVATYDLTYNELEKKPIVSLFSVFHSQVHTLILEDTPINCQNPAWLPTIFSNVPDNMTSLKLGYYTLADLSETQLCQVFASLPKTLEFLALRCNLFINLNYMAFATALRFIPANVAFIDFSDNCFANLTTEAFEFILCNIPNSVSEVIFSLKDFINRSESDLIKLARAMHYVIKVGFADDDSITDDQIDEDEALAINKSSAKYDSALAYKILCTLNKHVGTKGKTIYFARLSILCLSESCSIPIELIQLIFNYQFDYPPSFALNLVPTIGYGSFFFPIVQGIFGTSTHTISLTDDTQAGAKYMGSVGTNS